jgi:2-polyprenyl-3-methyl-5-hydroxy-6-metoxy-1,4-benzoquinol methylase
MWLRRAGRPFKPALRLVRSYMTAPLEAQISKLTELNRPGFPARESAVPDPFPHDLAPANRLAGKWASADIQHLWDHVSATWSRLGAEDPFYSVSTFEDFHIELFENAAAKFFESSQHDIERMYRWFERHFRTVPSGGTMVEYGCGVGRSTPSFGRKFSRVMALDISVHHINIARDIVQKAGLSNVEFIHISRIETLNELKDYDLFYSCIVLQHNPPPLIYEILTKAMSGLNPGGFAFFQVPTYAKGYEFDLDTYIAQLSSGTSEKAMETHLLPQETVFKIIEEQGCSVLEVQPDYCVGSYETWISNTFFVEKRS